MIGVRVNVPIGPDGEYTGMVEITSDNVEDMRMALDDLGNYVEDISLVAILGGIRPEEVGFFGGEIPSTVHHQCSLNDWCEHYSFEEN